MDISKGDKQKVATIKQDLRGNRKSVKRGELIKREALVCTLFKRTERVESPPHTSGIHNLRASKAIVYG